ncbi:MAG: transcription antitermination factor NusB [Candidatus Magnetobacterium sp. LHC-1]|uniref:Transcription antitermination protein NusB n=1 Tax=Candidatus Magnetobacterium casense TaxID=1455061 RepID=A0ABS6RUH8_9BACT|nr:transcription antitermination factor NusB [Candidatus Magnetobacterium casensis]MBF0609022.1 transcription antitermination factor NusB [Nitrospirota bacterium]MBV6340241.1 transcription antitermination factor NusB [Candidatus Magnetobacterium casensis]
MTRRQARELVLQTLFQFDFTGKIPGRSELEESIKDRVPSKEIIAFIDDLVTGTVGHIEEIDEIIAVTSQHWQLQRLATVDRNILRAATYELLYRDDIPAAVTINEAVDIAKKFSTVDSYSFINGVLDKISGDRQNKRNADKKN